MLPSCVVRGRKNPLYVGFPQRLRKARRDAGLSLSELARRAETTAATISVLEGGVSFPRVDTAERLARALGLSPCLLPFGIALPGEPAAELRCAGLPERLAQAREALGLSRLQLGRSSQTSDGLVRNTEAGRTVPTVVKIEQLAKALHVWPAWLAFGLGDRELPPGRQSRAAVQPGDPA